LYLSTFSTRYTREQVRRCENSKLSPALSDFDKRVRVKLQKVHDVKDDGWTGGSIRFPYAWSASVKSGTNVLQAHMFASIRQVYSQNFSSISQ